MTATLDFVADDCEILDNPRVVSVRQAKTNNLIQFSFVQTGAVSTREAGASDGKYVAGDRKFYCPMGKVKTQSGINFRPAVGDTVIDENGAPNVVLGVKPTETSKVFILYTRAPTLNPNTLDLVDIEKATPIQTPTGGISYSFSIQYSQVRGAIKTTGAAREWTNGRDHFTVTQRLFLETPLPLTVANFVKFGGKRYRILELSPDQIGEFQSWEVTEFQA